MKLRTFLFAIAILGSVFHPAAAQPKKKMIQVDAPSLEQVLSGPSMLFAADLIRLLSLHDY